MKVLILALAFALGCKKESPPPAPAPAIPGIPTTPVGPPPDPIEPEPDFVSFGAFESEILADLTGGLSSAEQENAAFITLCDQLNAGTLTDEMRRGVEKGINQLSTEDRIEPGTWIGANRCTLRVDLRDYNLTNGKWRNIIEQADPLKLESFTDRGLLIKQLTLKRRGWIHGSNFLETTLTNNTYYSLLGIPQDLNTFLDDFAGCDLQADFDDEEEELFFAGLRNSGIARNKNRSIYLHECRDGPFSGTYDTIVENITSAGRNLSINPFPREARTNQTFQHDASEFIGTLPNKLQFFALFNSQNEREICAPTTVVVDNVRPEIAPDICNARSCSSCHSDGLIQGTDFISRHVTGNPNFDQREIQIGQFFFGRQAGFDAAMRQANAGFADALSELRINGGNDPINFLTDRIRREMDVDLVAGMLSLKTEEFKQLLPQSPLGLLAVGQLLDGGTINFNDLVQIKDILIDDLNLFQEGVGQ